MKMDIDLETMLDIALGGPEIGPLNLNVLHGLMREVFQRINISHQNMAVEQEDPDFCNSYNFIKSKVDEKNKRPRTAGGTPQRVQSNVAVIVSDYVRVPIGEHSSDSKSTPANIEDRLRYIESELKHVKDFPTTDELRDWAKEKSSPDTVVTDLWHFVSLNHRTNGLEEGIQKLTELVDRLIGELRSLTEELNVTNGKVDDVYSQFKGLSDRMTYIDSKIDSKISDTKKTIGEQVDRVSAYIKHVENTLIDHPKFKDLLKLVSYDVYNDAQERAHDTVKDIREQLSGKLNSSMLDLMVSRDDFKDFMEILNSVDQELIQCAKLKDIEELVTKDAHSQVEQNTINSIIKIEKSLAEKADVSALDTLVSSADVDKLAGRMDDLQEIGKNQIALSNELKTTQEQLRRKADNDDVVDVVKHEDLKKTLNKIQNQQYLINEMHSWQKTFDNDEKPQLNSKINELIVQTSGISGSLSNLSEQIESDKKNNTFGGDVASLNNAFKELYAQFDELDKTCKDDIAEILNDLQLKFDVKLDKTALQPVKDYLENCYSILALQQQESLGETSHCNHQPRPPSYRTKSPCSETSLSQGMPSISSVPHPNFNDACAVTQQMKLNCLSCARPLPLQTVRGKPLNICDFDHFRLLQRMLKSDNDVDNERACGGRYTASMPPFIKKTSRPSTAKSLPAVSFENYEDNLIDSEVDIEGLDGKLYRGLVSKKDFNRRSRCKSASAQIRTVAPRPGSGKDRPICGL